MKKKVLVVSDSKKTVLNVYGHVLGRDMDRLGQVMDKVLFCDARVS